MAGKVGETGNRGEDCVARGEDPAARRSELEESKEDSGEAAVEDADGDAEVPTKLLGEISSEFSNFSGVVSGLDD